MLRLFLKPLDSLEKEISNLNELFLVKRVDSYYLPHEKYTTTNFRKGWDIAEKHASIPKDGLQKVHSISMYLYTNIKPQPPSETIYLDFNEAVREGRYGYGRSFQYHSLNFSLTDAMQILKQSQTCRTPYRRTKVYFDLNVLNKEIRFVFFASSSLNNEMLEMINTCFGAKLTYYSAYINESKVLIPSYEVFRVTDVQTNTWCDVIYTLKSTGISKSNLNCTWVYNGAESNLRSSFYTFIRASDTDYIMLFIMLIITVYH
uniref:NAD(P)(+)--arginine ADP-ribosyltransferase n=1 Tax=Hucho hucho TaxID=62062 RepID=A0A4W5MV60_9TELE